MARDSGNVPQRCFRPSHSGGEKVGGLTAIRGETDYICNTQGGKYRDRKREGEATATAAVGCSDDGSDDGESSSNGGVLWWNDDLRTHARGQRVSSIIAGDVHYAKNYQ